MNSAAFIRQRADECAKKRGKLPNIIAVDFADVGNVVGAVHSLNN